MMCIAALLLFTISGWKALGVLPFSESIPYAFFVLNHTSDSITLQMKEGFPSTVSDGQTKRLCFTLPHPERISKTFFDGSKMYFIYYSREVVEIEPAWTEKKDTTAYKLEIFDIQHINNRSPQVPLFDRIMLIKPRHKHHGEEPSLVTEEHFKIRHKQFEQIRNRKYYVLEGENATVCISVKNRNVDSFLRAIAGDEYSNLIAGVSLGSGAASSTLASYTWMADGAKYASARADGSGFVYKGALVFERNAAGKLSLDAALTTGGRITAQKDASTGAITGYTVHHHITDHLGSVRAVVDFAGNILETSDFLPYGTRWSQTGGSATGTLTDAANRWRYSGKEEQAAALNPALPLIDYGARMYDPTIARWMSVDPLAEKYYPMGGYNYCQNSPIIIVDPFGLDLYMFDSEGNYTDKIEQKGRHRIGFRIYDENKLTIRFLDFADPENDPKEIDEGKINRILFMTERDIRGMIERQGGFSASAAEFYQGSKGSGQFDYSTSCLWVYSNYSTPYHYRGTDNKNSGEMKSPFLFVPSGEHVAHNLMNFGNFLWGATGYITGFPTVILQLGGHFNSLINSPLNSYAPQFDSADDQISIACGVSYARKHHFKKNTNEEN